MFADLISLLSFQVQNAGRDRDAGSRAQPGAYSVPPQSRVPLPHIPEFNPNPQCHGIRSKSTMLYFQEVGGRG